MAKKTVVASDDALIVVNGKTMTVAQAREVMERKMASQREPGWYPDEDGDDYNFAIGERILPEDGGTVRWEIRPDGYINCHINLRFHHKKPIPGFGGKRSRWVVYKDYFRGANFIEDLKKCFGWSEAAEKNSKAKA